jgi:hypothetical protein
VKENINKFQRKDKPFQNVAWQNSGCLSLILRKTEQEGIKMKKLFLTILFFLLIGTQLTWTSPAYPLKIGPDKRYLVDQNNVPFLINGDTPWSLLVEANSSEVEQYLTDRKQRGFNAIIFNLLEHNYCSNPPYNVYGEKPFNSGTMSNADFTTPNEDYFAFADEVINKAAAKDICVFLCYCYATSSQDGWGKEIQANGITKCSSFGHYVGKRYKNYKNIVWLGGGDGPVTGYVAEFDAIANGIKAEDAVFPKLHSAHCNRGKSALDCYDRPWLTLNNTYSECINTLSKSINDYNRYLSRGIPFFYMEGDYEENGRATQVCLRSQAYWNILSGSTGHFFGHYQLFRFGSTWPTYLNTPGARSMTYMNNLFLSRQWHLLVPDISHSVVTSGTSSLAAALTSDGATLIAYMPSRRTVSVNLSKLSGSQVKAWWYYPNTGTASAIGVYPKSGSRSFSPPSTGSTDWVLVVDDASMNYPAPGKDDMVLTEESGGPDESAGLGIQRSLPNPFSLATRIIYTVPGIVKDNGKSKVRFSIFNLQGQRVRQLINGPVAAGRHAIIFNGQDNYGNRLPAGIYICKLEAGGIDRVKNLRLIKLQ